MPFSNGGIYMKKFGMLKIMVITLSLILILIPIYTYGAGRWKQLSDNATDIGIGADGSVWIIGTSEVNGGYGVYRLSVNGWEQIEIDGGAIRIDVDPSGNPWIVDNDGNIFRRSGTEWETIDGEATDIGIGADGSVWIIGTNPVSGGYGIYRWDGRNWEEVDGGAVQISVDNRGTPWIVDSEDYIYVWVSFNWKSIQEYFGIIFKK
jgi:hypothetical protein